MKPNLLMSIILPFFLPGKFFVQAFHPSRNIEFTIQWSGSGDNPYPFIHDILLPDGYRRVDVEKNSFGAWLRNIALKKNKTVFLYNGVKRNDQSSQFAVLNFSVGTKDLQQCADAVMRLRAEYLYSQQRFPEIVFSDNNNKSYKCKEHADRKEFDNYLDNVFVHCGTLSLQKQLRRISALSDVRVGDVLIQGGSPGHAMLIVDMATNKDGKKIFLLAQGFMPAQDIHVVINPKNQPESPWYQLSDQPVETPGWLFPANHFMKW